MSNIMKHLCVEEESLYIPHEVVEMVIRQHMPLVKAWRIYKGLTVEKVADSSDLKVYELEQLEAGENEVSFHLEKAAKGLGVVVEQLTDL